MNRNKKPQISLDSVLPESYRSGAGAGTGAVAAAPPLSLLSSRRSMGPNLNDIVSQSRGEPPPASPAPASRPPPASPAHIEFARSLNPEPPAVVVPPPTPPRAMELSPIDSLMADIGGLDADTQRLFSSEVTEALFVNNMPIPSNAQEIGYEQYVGSVLQFIFTNQTLWRFFIIPNDRISTMVGLMRSQQTRNGLTDTQVHLFILIIKYIFLLYSSRSSIRNVNECVRTWTDNANAAYNVLCKHIMTLIRNRGIMARNFEELFSTILDCMPNSLKPSIVDNGNPATKFLKLPLLRGSLQDYLTTNNCQLTPDKVQTFFVAFYSTGQRNNRDAVSVSQSPDTVTLLDGTRYRKLIHIDTRYSASIASPTGDSGQNIFATNSTGVATRENSIDGTCTALLQEIYPQPPNFSSRLVVMYQKIPPPLSRYQTVKKVAVGTAAAGLAGLAGLLGYVGYNAELEQVY